MLIMEDITALNIYSGILYKLMPGSAPNLGGLPVVILYDACRGRGKTQTAWIPKEIVTKEDEQQVSTIRNYLVAFATLDKHFSYMHQESKSGSAWMQTVARMLKCHQEDIETVLTKVNGEIEKMAQERDISFQQPQKDGTLNELVYIHPDAKDAQGRVV